jgi:RHS repeat-associated protein
MTGFPFSRNRRARGRRPVVGALAAVAALLAAGLAAPPVAQAAAARPVPAQPLKVPTQKAVPVHAVPARTVTPPPEAHLAKPAPPRWPAAGSATITVAAGARTAAATASAAGPALALPGKDAVRAGRLPVWAAPASGGVSGAAVQASVTVASHAVAVAAGVRGVVFSIERTSSGPSATVHVSLGYKSFASAYGGNYASRLHLVELPACVLTDPAAAACRRAVPVGSANDTRASALGADVTLSALAPAQMTLARHAASPAAAVILAATTSPASAEGDYSATPLSQEGNWAQAGSSGAFTYSYPVHVPPVPGGLTPDVTLGYSSQEADGLTSTTNDQASWAGDGWDYSPGYIERDYAPCTTKPSGATNWVKSSDLCMSPTETTTLSLNGFNTTLVPQSSSSGTWQDASGTTWRAETDQNENVQFLTGAANGTGDGAYWVITKPDGTKYYFGQNELPGWASGDATTGSVYSAPVYQYQSGEPCYNATAASAKCALGWRWNLDYVVDPHGNAMAYFYEHFNNYYANFNGTTGSAAYQTGGDLTKIEYGLRSGSLFGSGAGSLAAPDGEVVFGVSGGRTDVPTDLSCSSGAACGVQAPTFWNKGDLSSITTYELEGSTPALAEADSWAIGHTADQQDPDPGASTPPLWLSSITRTGQDGGSTALPAETFSGHFLDNRIDSGDSYPSISRERLTTVTTETGQQISVGYDTPPGACSGTGTLPAPDANTGLCYPDWWVPTAATGQVESWFNKYVVTSVTRQDTVGSGTATVTTYCYGGAGTAGSAGCLSGGAWHYDDDSLTRSQNRTWDEWRGFGEVTTETGTAPDPVTETQDTYFQGMDGDYQSGGGTSSVTLTSSRSTQSADSDQYAGMNFEHVTCNGAAANASSGFCGDEISDTVSVPWSGITASQTQTAPLPPLASYRTGTAETLTYIPGLASGGTRQSTVSYTHDSRGRVTQASAVPDTTDPSLDTCTTTSYASDASGISSLTSEVTKVSGTCAAPAALPGGAISDSQSFYDGSTTLGAAPTAGNLTETKLATSYSGTTPAYTVESQKTYDSYGRVLTSTDADGRTTTTAYSPAAAGEEPTLVTVDAPTTQNGTTATTVELVTKTTYDPARGLPLTSTTPAGYVTTETYDPLGRLTAVWKPGDPTSGPATDKYTYTVGSGVPSVVTTQALNAAGNYQTDETLYDSLGRVLETQDETADGKSTVTDTVYNSDGWKRLVSNPYFADAAPSATLIAASGQVPSQTGYGYDGDGRVTSKAEYNPQGETAETDTSYGGDYTTVTYVNKVAGQPDGGTPQTTFTNAENHTTSIWQYHAGVPASVTDPAADYDRTGYTYTPAGQLAHITDAAGDQWSYGYNLAGDRTSASDPDTGSTSSTYDPAGQLSTTTDARGWQVTYNYDADGRKIAEYDTSGSSAASAGDTTAGKQLAAWSYDTLKKGLLTSAISYSGGNAYTEQAAGYNTFAESTGEIVSLPAAVGGNLAGTWEVDYGYTNYTGQLDAYQYHADGGLPAEDVSVSYDAAGQPDALTSPAWNYAASLSYTELGQPQEYTLGTTATPAWILNSYDPQTGVLASSTMETGTTPATVDATAYTYDNTQDITSEADTPSGGPAQVQCFTYDYLGRLSKAWSQGTAGCPASPPQQAEAGAAAPYWNTYGYTTSGNLTSITSTSPTAGTTTTTNVFWPAGTGAAGTPQEPSHGISQQTVTPAAGPAAVTTYADNADGAIKKITPQAGTAQTMQWDDLGRLMLAATGTQQTSYIYDADGNLLLRQDPAATTLFLPNEQISQGSSGAFTGALRYYSIGGKTIAVRSSSGAVNYLDSDEEGTATVAVNVSSLAVTRRHYDPYGNPVTATAGTATWPGNDGFQQGTPDSATGLENIGARQYLPGISAFISPDPILAPYSPQDLNAYAYAQDSAPTSEDPSGKFIHGPQGSNCAPGVNAPQCNGTGTIENNGSLGPGSGPGMAVLPQNLDYNYDKWLPTFQDANPYAHGATQVLDSLAVFCGNIASCPGALASTLLQDWHGLIEQTAVLLGVSNFAGIGRTEYAKAGPGGGNMTADAESEAAQGDLNQLEETGGGRVLWTSWQNYPKVTVDGREYAQIGDRLYTQHAVDRMQPSGLGTPAGAPGPGRSISPNFIEDVLDNTQGVPVKGPAGETRLSYSSGSVQVITEDGIVITVITR